VPALPCGPGASIIAPIASPTFPRTFSEYVAMTEQEQIELEAAAFRQLVQHLRDRTDVQNIELMNLAGFCRNCLSKWYKAAADDVGLPVTIDQAREEVYGMPYSEWKTKYQKEASSDQQAAFNKGQK
jgi:hypothetical protein